VVAATLPAFLLLVSRRAVEGSVVALRFASEPSVRLAAVIGR
jgi:hypothetical protein